MNNYCCELMRINIKDLNTISYESKFNEYRITLPEDHSYIILNYCPWCGKKLPTSMRNKWFEKMRKLGIDNPYDENIPAIYMDDRWYNS